MGVRPKQLTNEGQKQFCQSVFAVLCQLCRPDTHALMIRPKLLKCRLIYCQLCSPDTHAFAIDIHLWLKGPLIRR